MNIVLYVDKSRQCYRRAGQTRAASAKGSAGFTRPAQSLTLPGIAEYSIIHFYFTAPQVMPCTSCFWQNQPSAMIGAIAINEAADSLAQNKPSGLE